MQLIHATWPQVEAYLARSRGLVIPVGSTEQHGPLGLIGTDSMAAEAIALRMSQQVDVLVAPTLSLSVAQFNLGFPGTISLRAATMMALVGDVLRSLSVQGFQRFYFLNGHGANVATVQAACQDFYADWSLGLRSGEAPRCRLRSWWDYPQPDRLRRKWYGAWEGMHATPSEVALTMALQPQAFERAAAAADPPPRPLPEGYLRHHAGDNHADARSHRAMFPDGRVGSHSSLATADQGSELLQAAAADACTDYQAFLAEP